MLASAKVLSHTRFCNPLTFVKALTAADVHDLLSGGWLDRKLRKSYLTVICGMESTKLAQHLKICANFRSFSHLKELYLLYSNGISLAGNHSLYCRKVYAFLI
mmetsp:Transcript_28176/g.76061  ORF Transcript_28176/g.76061 Transcript_28176/m.76061 type:complete len:103 (+) Transcript_28176:925-1233(+)